MLNYNSTMINTEDLKKMVSFYSEVFDKKPDMDDEGYAGFVVGNGFFGIGFHDKIHGKNPNSDRILFNFETNDVKGEFERVSKIDGVKIVKEPYSMGDDSKYWIATLADPDGNYFQLVTPWNESEKKN
ncbi:MAG TPA: VOC family protein [Patescibacteria group bacterium]|nr:VOC family protein [Patescibacteria group bacterium]